MFIMLTHRDGWMLVNHNPSTISRQQCVTVSNLFSLPPSSHKMMNSTLSLSLPTQSTVNMRPSVQPPPSPPSTPPFPRTPHYRRFLSPRDFDTPDSAPETPEPISPLSDGLPQHSSCSLESPLSTAVRRLTFSSVRIDIPATRVPVILARFPPTPPTTSLLTSTAAVSSLIAPIPPPQANPFLSAEIPGTSTSSKRLLDSPVEDSSPLLPPSKRPRAVSPRSHHLAQLASFLPPHPSCNTLFGPTPPDFDEASSAFAIFGNSAASSTTTNNHDELQDGLTSLLITPAIAQHATHSTTSPSAPPLLPSPLPLNERVIILENLSPGFSAALIETSITRQVSPVNVVRIGTSAAVEFIHLNARVAAPYLLFLQIHHTRYPVVYVIDEDEWRGPTAHDGP
ncbi:hypothetical protein CC85DRAFT_43164 [Cutaneotrichosporon oleaginosum]|uniref:Uncharacterized protein n=1 Tax=Cutaneotrichosporon oleaginosum TaxID=879819 RepID=A0A0J0XRP4_9TREE|nr:uncharacterized protein CC85DRAFT_43164 [Cutaneotrichosporon oleaginosum]KLT43755.1 hypothetical protein CC85DRAFT_43164 [Cutaneotrichosporon oleaginosum]TXT05172.1 hypothetical protein COLE_06492 [Cutaneotrichosporon oleaginosum]